MDQQLEELRSGALAELERACDEGALETLRVKYIGRTGSISVLSQGMKAVSKVERPRIGKLLNEVRNEVTAAIEARKSALAAERDAAALAGVDVTLPGYSDCGRSHASDDSTP